MSAPAVNAASSDSVPALSQIAHALEYLGTIEDRPRHQLVDREDATTDNERVLLVERFPRASV